MGDLFQKFIEDVKKNYPKNKDKVLSALEFADQSHAGIKRKSGEPYIIHPIAVSQILMDNQLDYSSVMAGLLHDVVEDTIVTIEEIEERFGKTVAKLVDGVTKIDKITLERENLTEDDSRKRLLLAMGDDIRVIFIKLADRLHNMRTIKFLKPERQIAIGKETQELFIPIAELLGVRNLRSELQSLTFECLFKDDYEKIKLEHDTQLNTNLKKIRSIEKKLNDIVSKNVAKANIAWWPERYYSIYKKMKKTGVSKAYGLVLFKIIVPTVADCYKTLGLIHQLYKPLPLQIKDYIASPKINGYQSLQTVVMSEDSSITFNVMIRTPEMNNICEYGVFGLASSKDSSGEDFNSKFEKHNKLKAIISGENKSEFVASSTFVESIKTDISQKSTWVFTTKFKPTKIDSGNPSAIDFAYVLGDEVGNNAQSVIINGKSASLGAELKSGDVVEIIESTEPKAPCRAWFSVAKTHYARQKIRDYFAANLNSKNVKNGKKQLQAEFEEKGYSVEKLKKAFERSRYDFSFVSADDMFATIGCGGLKPSQISAYVSDDDKKENSLLSAPIVVEGVTFASKVLFSKCCCPILGDEIVAVKTQNNISIHTANCSNLKKCQKDKILKASWKPTVKKEFEVNLKIVAKDTVGFGANLLGSISHLGVNITKMFAKQKNSLCEFKLTLKIKDVSELKKVADTIAKVEGVKSINRSFD